VADPGASSRSVEFVLSRLGPCATANGTSDLFTAVSTREEMTEAPATALTAITTAAISHLRLTDGAKPNSDQEFALKRIPAPNCDLTSLSEI
jgi:hypothetical protein